MEYSFKYGKGEQKFDFPEDDVVMVVNPAEVEIAGSTEEEKVREAIDHPIGSPKLEDIIKPGETVCVIVPDTTRLWQHPDIMCGVLIKKLEEIGVADSDMLIISALGTHRKQTEEEMRAIVGDDVYDRVRMEDHDCDHNLVEVGTTSDGNVVELNATAMSYDHRILVGGVVFHFLAGFGGGRKTILPGISSRKTIMHNHSHYFNPGGLGSGRDMNVSCGVLDKANKVHQGMVEAARLAKVDFIVNDIAADGKITFCYAGDLEKAHEAAAEQVRKIDGVVLDKKADMVIASACGYPKDINLYQTSKTIINSQDAVELGDGVMIIVSECSEGWGSPDTEKFAVDFDNTLDREQYCRDNYTIGMNVAYLEFALAEELHFILVSSMAPELFSKTKIHPVSTITEAIELAKKLTGKDHLSTYLLPHGANTCVSIKA